MLLPARSFSLAMSALCFATNPGTAQNPVDQRLATARAYSGATIAAMQQDATPATIDRVLGFLSDSAEYEHPMAGARIVRAHIGAGMLSHRGETRNARVKILGELVTSAGVELEEDLRFEVRTDAGWKAMHRVQVRILQFAGPKISRVIEVWLPAR